VRVLSDPFLRSHAGSLEQRRRMAERLGDRLCGPMVSLTYDEGTDRNQKGAWMMAHGNSVEVHPMVSDFLLGGDR
jgi:hypothetical protein